MKSGKEILARVVRGTLLLIVCVGSEVGVMNVCPESVVTRNDVDNVVKPPGAVVGVGEFHKQINVER